MKNPFHYIQQYPKRTKQLLEISHEQFQQLLVQAEARHNQQQAEKEKTRCDSMPKAEDVNPNCP